MQELPAQAAPTASALLAQVMQPPMQVARLPQTAPEREAKPA